MKNPREYYLSACFCACPVRRREAGRKPDTCELCGGWLPDYPADAVAALSGCTG